MSAMEAVVGKGNLKVFHKALMCLSKVGTDLVVETLSDRVVLRALSQSESAFGHFSFAKIFFDSFRHLVNGVEKPTMGDDVAFFKCKVNVKSILTAFRGIGNCEKLVFGLDAQNSLLIFQLATTRTGIQRTYQFPYMEQTDILQAEFSRSTCPNILSANAKFLNHYMSAFPNDGEITLVATHNGLKVFNFVESGDPGRQGVMSKNELDQHLRASLQTQYLIDARDFERFNVLDEYIGTEITFCLRELKAMLSFCEATDHTLHIFFHTGGMPILLTTSHDDKTMFAADVVVATLQNENQVHHPANSKDERWPSQRGTPSQAASQNSFGQDGFRPSTPAQQAASQPHYSQATHPTQHSSQQPSQHQQQQPSQHSSQGGQFSQPRPPNQFNRSATNQYVNPQGSFSYQPPTPQYSHPSNQQPFTRPPIFQPSNSSAGGCSSSSSSSSSGGHFNGGCGSSSSNGNFNRQAPHNFDSQSTRSLAPSFPQQQQQQQQHQQQLLQQQQQQQQAPQTHLQKQAQQKQQQFMAQYQAQQQDRQSQQPQSQSSQSPTQQQSQTQVQSQQQLSQYASTNQQPQHNQNPQFSSQHPQSYHQQTNYNSEHQPFPLSSHLPYQASKPFQNPPEVKQAAHPSQNSIRLHFEMSPPQELRHISPIHAPHSQNSFNSQSTLPSNFSFDLEPGFVPPTHAPVGPPVPAVVAPLEATVHVIAGQRTESQSQEAGQTTVAQIAFLRGGQDDEESVDNDEGDYVPGTPQVVPQVLTRQHAAYF